MDTPNAKRKNQKLQVIDLTDETFEFKTSGFTISGFTAKDGKKWFSAQIACDNLDIANVSQAVAPLPYDEKAIISLTYNGIPTRYLVVSEPGLFRLIFRSRKTEAKQYQDWVFNEVLPAIHKYGGYISPAATPDQIKFLEGQIAELQNKLDNAQQVNYWLAADQRVGEFITRSLPPGDED